MEQTLVAIAVVLTTLGTSYYQSTLFYSDSQRTWAEWAAWGSIALVCRFLNKKNHQHDSHDDKEAQQTPNWTKPSLEKSATVLALLLVASHCVGVHFSEANLQWSYPLTTLFVVIQLYLNGHRASKSRLPGRDPPPGRGATAAVPTGRRLDHGIRGVLLVGICLTSSIALLPRFGTLSQPLVLVGMVNACMMAMAYALIFLVSNDDHSAGTESPDAVQLVDILQPTATRAFALVTLYLALFSVPFPPLRSLALVPAVLRTAQAVSVFYLCTQRASVAASALFTASAAIFDCSHARDPFWSGLYFLVAAAALALTDSGLHKGARSRIWLFVLLLLPVTNLLTSGLPYLDPLGSSSNKSIGRVHPISQLVENSNNHFTKILHGQSKTLEEAVTEYKRRYGRRPPPGFDRWFAIAKEKEFLFIDEFDTIMESLEPYWGVPASTLRARYTSIQGAAELVEFQVRGDKVEHTSDHYHAAYLMEWMNHTTWGDIVPDLNFMISTLDEPRVVAPYDTVSRAIKYANAHKQVDNSRLNTELHETYRAADRVKWISVGRQDAWEALLSSCHIDSPARSELVREGLNQQNQSLPFVSNTTASMDVCASPDLLHGHGFLASPESLMITHSLVPIFAQCKTSVFNDILYPSPYYEMQMTSGDYDESTDSAWDEKLDRVYWAGGATGGYSTAHNWMLMHRQRLTLMTASDSDKPVSLLSKDDGGIWQTIQSTWSSIAHLFYLKITNIVQCSDEACTAMTQRFSSANGTMESEPKEAALGSKYALDIDGNTFSGRYYRLLKSNVCVLKHTSFKEWHDGRLVPWVHYVPVSPGAEELGEIMRYFTQDEEGKGIGRNIASQGRDWARKTLRKEDLEVVFVRVLMEYARFMSDERDGMGFGL